MWFLVVFPPSSRHFSKYEENPFHPWYLHSHCHYHRRHHQPNTKCKQPRKETNERVRAKKLSHDRKEIIRFLVLLCRCCLLYCILCAFIHNTQLKLVVFTGYRKDIHEKREKKNFVCKETRQIFFGGCWKPHNTTHWRKKTFTNKRNNIRKRWRRKRYKR